jgi:hypothetical protein
VITPRVLLDHVVIAAASLEQGILYAADALGVSVPHGGRHIAMGTHNAVAQAGSDRFIEILAVDPAGIRPGRPRWFGLDVLLAQQDVVVAPHLAAWVASTSDIDASLAAARDAGLDLGRPVGMSRGDLHWRISMRDDGQLPESGTLPILIEWPEGPHPFHRMRDIGLTLDSIMLRHPEPDRLTHWLDRLGAGHLVAVDPRGSPAAGIEAAFRSPRGLRRLSSC